jgi:WD40 repeat protein
VRCLSESIRRPPLRDALIFSPRAPTAWARLATGFILASLIGVAGCAKDPTRPFPSLPSFLPPAIDDYPAWSHDGAVIAYLRFVPSADGPAGVYLISKWGGTPRLVASGYYGQFRFSPDGRRLVAVSPDQQMAVIDLLSGQIVQPFYTDKLVGGPDWSPDGEEIVYLRGGPNAGEPPDSSGIHVFNLKTRADRALTAEGSLVSGIPRDWLPTGEIAVVSHDPAQRHQLEVIDPARAESRVLYVSRRTYSFWLLTWYSRPSTAQWGILFTDNDSPPYGGNFLIRPDGRGLTRMTLGLAALGNGHEAFSPDGEEWVHHGLDPVDSLDVLFVSRIGDRSRASERQLTKYSAPPSQQGGGG